VNGNETSQTLTPAVIWRRRVEAHHAQSLRTQAEMGWSAGDFWHTLSDRFEADPERTGDPVLERLFREVTPETTVLDVGGGAGRLALPLAKRCRSVTVVDSSESMLERLAAGAERHGLRNVRAVRGLWEEAEVEPADLVICAHVIYGIVEIEAFLGKLEAHARRRVAIFAHLQSPLARFAEFWARVHGEARINLPAAPELLAVLWSRSVYPNLEMFPPLPRETAPSREAALGLLRHFLFVRPETEADGRLRAALAELSEPAADTHQLYHASGGAALAKSGEPVAMGVALRGAAPRREALITWAPEDEC
jgi:SAM-dependent methyltransferase